MNRRTFIAGLGCATAWPVGVAGQQLRLPTIGFLGTTSISVLADFVAAFRVGLREAGYVEGKDVKIEFRWADGHYGELPRLAAELVASDIIVMFAGGPPAALAAKNATSEIPIVFTSGDDPVEIGLVSSLSRPGGNVTGVSIQFREIEAKRVELLGTLVPTIKSIGLLYNTSRENIELLHEKSVFMFTPCVRRRKAKSR